ncbi:PIN domain-containing protein [Ructibacterium gallinarum]|uniref:PIN domain-containing protein n=1 Tax=Ructibacterium gallinarum TaxID=2779355 RepID=A0A9D5LZP0_9FIRM|nr:PIN domain-containing protein [Ructibacterium gallinarum]MBE5041011.1 PIN domain-containing protein [Ructibacterium gallinarum]
MRAFIDTCVIIDVLQNREPFADDAKKIFLAVANEQFDGYVSAKSITDIYYLTHRLTHSDEQTRQILKTLLGLFGILDTTALDCRKALSSDISDYEDAVMCETAERCEIDCIVTRNEKDYAKAKVSVYTPDKFIKILENTIE